MAYIVHYQSDALSILIHDRHSFGDGASGEDTKVRQFSAQFVCHLNSLQLTFFANEDPVEVALQIEHTLVEVASGNAFKLREEGLQFIIVANQIDHFV